MDTTTKVCQQCGEEIKAIARKCPYCQSWQKGFNSFLVNQPAAASLFALIPAGVFLIWFTFFSQGLFGRKGVSFDQHRQQIAVQNSTVSLKQEGGKTYITTVGTIKNSSDKDWGEVYIEVQYFNEAGELIDGQSELDYGMILSANGETAFRLSQEAAKAMTEYKTHKVIVKRAEEARSRWL